LDLRHIYVDNIPEIRW